MIIPPLIGMFTIPGGAILSAPFVYNIGEDLEMPKVDRAAINLIFRHVAVFALPYNASLLLVSNSLTDINIYKFIMMNSILVASILITGYLLFLREVEVESKGSDENIVKNLFNLIILTSPIYSSVIINTLFGIPFYIGVGFSILIVYLLGNKSGF